MIYKGSTFEPTHFKWFDLRITYKREYVLDNDLRTVSKVSRGLEMSSFLFIDLT